MRRGLMTAASAVALFAALAGGAIMSDRSDSHVARASEPGTIKVYDETACKGEHGSSEDPKVTSPFSIGGTNFTPGAATLVIVVHPGGTTALTQAVVVGEDGTFCVSPITLDADMYKAHLFRGDQADGKHKVFKVEAIVTTTTTTTTTTTLPDDSTTTTSVDSGGPTTTAAPTTTAVTTTTVVGSNAVTTTSTPTVIAGGPTPATGAETWVLALMAALSLLGGAALVGVTRR